MRSALGPDHEGAHGVDREVASGQPGRVLVEESAGAALLVVGSQGYGGLVGSLIGSVSRYCLHHALCPVAIVPHHLTVAERERLLELRRRDVVAPMY
mgnify:CR=1 FL=1